MKLSAKTLVIGIATLVVAGGSVAYYLATQDKPETLGWMNSSWLYRKGVTVANSGSTLLNEDVLIEVNTATLVTAGKLQSDCDDLRFTDSDESTSLSYWVEAGCNTTTTQVWVRIPSLPSGGKTIYMYYGNASASNSEEAWSSGNFTMLYNSTCPSGWTRRSDLDDKFPYGATTSGTTGGSSSHDHGVYTGSTSGYAGIFQSATGATTVASNYHGHSGVSITVNTNSTVFPAYMDMVFCSKSKLDIATGLVGIFESTPGGWTRFSALDGVIPRGASSYGVTGGSDTHTHTTTGDTTDGPNGTTTAGGTGCNAGSSGHTHTISAASTGSGSNLPPYLSVIFASADSDTYGVDDMVTIVNSVPPLGWTQFSALDSKYPRGASSYGGTGGTETHTHSYSQGTSSGSTTAVQCSGTGNYVGTGSDHSFSFTTNSYSNHPPYLTVVYAQRKVSQTASVGTEEQETPPPQSDWMNSSWLYRIETTVPNTGSTLTNEEVLIQVNTASLITAEKLQSDCDDLRVTDSDGTTPISYWVEGGCNTTTTQIWAEIPSLPEGGKTIFVYYGNSSAVNAEISWSGNFILLADASCPSGWTRNTSFDGKYAYGSTTYGTSGGNATHNHGGSLSATSGGASAIGGTGGDTNTECSNWATATHTISGTISSENNTPPYISTLFCQRSKLTDIGALTFFSDSSTPSGWTRQTAFDSYFPYGSSTYGTTGGSTTHTHTLSSLTCGQSAQACEDIDPPNPYSRSISVGTHTHSTITINSNGSASSMPPYKVLLYVEAPTSTATLNESLIAMVTVNPPLGWTQYSAANDYFIQGGSSVNLTAQGNSTHTHDATFTLEGTSASMSRNASSMQMAAGSHTHTASYTTPSASSVPSYLTVIYSKKNTSISTTTGTEETENDAPTAPTSPLTEGVTNPISVTDTTPEFSAIFNDPNTGDTGTKYQIQVNTASNFTGTSMWDSTLTSMTATAIGARSPDISYAGTTLTLNGTTYYWRIRFADDNDVTGEWSSAASFLMQGGPLAPTDLLTDGATNPTRISSLTPTFSAIYTDPNEDDGNYYEIEVNTNNTFTGTVMWDSGQQDTGVAHGYRVEDIVYAGTPLTNENTTYYWRIRFWDTEDLQGAWSATAQFSSLQTSFKIEGLQFGGIKLD